MAFMKNLITILLLTLTVSLYSQEKREMINGEEFIIHTVKKGETLYGISQKYKVSKKKLRGSNSGMLLFIKVGQELKIPVPNDEKTVHLVKKGETLYGISKKYGISVNDLTKLNPVKSKNLKEGDKLILKSKANSSKASSTDVVSPIKQKTSIHTVKKGETLYGIARKYGISVSELKKLNPGIKENISIGDKLNVPTQIAQHTIKPKNEVKQEVKTKSKTIEYTVEKGETFYGIAKKYNTSVDAIQKANPGVTSLKEGDKLKIVLPKDYVQEVKVTLGEPIKPDGDYNKINKINPLKDKLNEMVLEKKETYSVSLFLPFMLAKNAQIPQEVGKPTKVNPYTEMSTHFYQGFMMGMDSVSTTGVSINLNVYDTKNDTSQVGKYLRGNDVKKSDLIVGPFFEKPYTQVAKFSKANGIQAVCPVNQSNRLLFNNKYVTELNTSLPSQVSYLATYLAANRNTENVICVSGKSKKDKYLSTLFNTKYNKSIAGKSNNYRSKSKTFSFVSFSSMRGFDAKLVKGKKNVIIIPITQEGLATSFFTQLNVMMSRSRMKGYEIEVYALENFLEYEDIETNYKLKYNLHVTSPSYIDYSDERVKNFIRNYRTKYGTEPSKYAFIGFDVALYHGAAMSNFGKNYPSYYGQVKVPLLQANYVLKRSDMNSGFENQSVFILKYEDYKLVKLN